ncbi:MAG TPA: hypothetical protein PK950_01395 [Candidatus Paceibacterota bacterium]|nr:hypothetical protein [Candidatus Paceibacterota bacterium]
MKTTLFLLVALFASCTPKAQTSNQLAIEQAITTLVGTIEKMPKYEYVDPNLARSFESRDTTGIKQSNTLFYTNVEADGFRVFRTDRSNMVMSYKSSGKYSCFSFVEKQERKYRFEKLNDEIKLSYFESEITDQDMWGQPIRSFVEKSYTLNDIYDGFAKNLDFWNNIIAQQNSDSSYLHLRFVGYFLNDENEEGEFKPITFHVQITSKTSGKLLLEEVATITPSSGGVSTSLGTVNYVSGSSDDKALTILVSYDQDEDHGGAVQKEVTIAGKSTRVDLEIENDRKKYGVVNEE